METTNINQAVLLQPIWSHGPLKKTVAILIFLCICSARHLGKPVPDLGNAAGRRNGFRSGNKRWNRMNIQKTSGFIWEYAFQILWLYFPCILGWQHDFLPFNSCYAVMVFIVQAEPEWTVEHLDLDGFCRLTKILKKTTNVFIRFHYFSIRLIANSKQQT